MIDVSAKGAVKCVECGLDRVVDHRTGQTGMGRRYLV